MNQNDTMEENAIYSRPDKSIWKVSFEAIHLWRLHGGRWIRLSWTHVDVGRESAPCGRSKGNIRAH